MNTTQRVWAKNFEQVTTALRPWVRGDADFQWVDESAPANLTAHYRSLCLVGFAQGWMP
jgi:hypothetical protein